LIYIIKEYTIHSRVRNDKLSLAVIEPVEVEKLVKVCALTGG
jgi:hypothetical protein